MREKELWGFNKTDIISWAITLVSLCGTIYFGVNGIDSKYLGVLLVFQGVLLFMWGKILYDSYIYQGTIKNKDSEILSLNNRLDQLNTCIKNKDNEVKQTIVNIEKVHKEKINLCCDLQGKIINCIKNLTKLNNDFCINCYYSILCGYIQ